MDYVVGLLLLVVVVAFVVLFSMISSLRKENNDLQGRVHRAEQALGDQRWMILSLGQAQGYKWNEFQVQAHWELPTPRS